MCGASPKIGLQEKGEIKLKEEKLTNGWCRWPGPKCWQVNKVLQKWSYDIQTWHVASWLWNIRNYAKEIVTYISKLLVNTWFNFCQEFRADMAAWDSLAGRSCTSPQLPAVKKFQYTLQNWFWLFGWLVYLWLWSMEERWHSGLVIWWKNCFEKPIFWGSRFLKTGFRTN